MDQTTFLWIESAALKLVTIKPAGSPFLNPLVGENLRETGLLPTKMPAILSTSFCTGALLPCAHWRILRAESFSDAGKPLLLKSDFALAIFYLKKLPTEIAINSDSSFECPAVTLNDNCSRNGVR